MNTAEPTVFETSPWSMVLLGLGGLAMAILCGAIALGLLPTRPVDDLRLAMVALGCPFFLLCAAVAAWRLVRLRGPVVTLAPEGIRDLRVAQEFIPWAAIQGISTWSHRSQHMMVLAVDPQVERGLTLNPIVRWTRAANRKLGTDGLVIAATGLKTSYDTLLATAAAYRRAHT